MKEHTLQNSLGVLVKTCIEPQIGCNRLIECEKILEVDKIYSCSTLTLTHNRGKSPGHTRKEVPKKDNEEG